MERNQFVSWTLESVIRIILLSLILLITFLIFKPFLVLIVWGIIISIALYPLFKWFKKILKGKGSLASALLTLLLLTLLVVPSALFINLLIDSISTFSDTLASGTFHIKRPPENVKEWPVVGKSINDIWMLFSTNFEAGVEKFGPQIREYASVLFQSIGQLVGSIFIFIGAVIIAGIFFVKADSSYQFSTKLATNLVGASGETLIKNSIATVQSVVKGVIGVALIQTILIAIGFILADIPGAPIWIAITFILSLIQLPPTLVIIPVAIYVFSVESTTFSIIFTVYSLIAGLSDNFLKPLLLGRGLEIPMLVILIGAIGGMLLMGVVGLFVGPVIFALAYQLFNKWLNHDSKEHFKMN